MIKKLLLIILLFLVGCDDTENAHCDESTAEARESFIAGCMVNHSTGDADEVQAAAEFCRIQSQIHFCKAET